MRRRILTLLFILGMFVAPSVWAHHSMAMFDSSRTVTYTGSVTKFNYTNPHVYITAEVQKDGKKASIVFEAGSPFALKEYGWSSKSLVAGEKVMIVAHPMKDDSNFGMLISITKANGYKLTWGPQPEDDKH